MYRKFKIKLNSTTNRVLTAFLVLFAMLILSSCKIPDQVKPSTVKKNVPINAKERARQNINEGRGISLKGALGGRSTTYEFSTSNPLWRASLEIIDFMPLTTVDYSGGIIITDWYTDSSNSKDSIKITLRFLSNEVRSDSLKIIIHKKTCNSKGENCIVQKISSPKLEQTIRADIIKKAALLVENAKNKKKR